MLSGALRSLIPLPGILSPGVCLWLPSTDVTSSAQSPQLTSKITPLVTLTRDHVRGYIVNVFSFAGHLWSLFPLLSSVVSREAAADKYAQAGMAVCQ